MIRGASFNSVPDKGILYLRFPDKGNHVAVTIGDRNDMIAAPLWYWAISDKGQLVLTDYSGEKLSTMELIEYSSSEVLIRSRGALTSYKRTKK